ncbi:MAG: ECF-type sigma factor [Planctomycetaceae bacterium]
MISPKSRTSRNNKRDEQPDDKRRLNGHTEDDQLDEGSVTFNIRMMRKGDKSSADFLWARFSRRLELLVKTRLHPRHRHVSDEEDVVLESLTELFRGLLDGKYSELFDRNDFWRLLVTVASRNVIDHVNHEKRQKRGGGHVRNESALTGGKHGGSQMSLLEQVESDCPPPDMQLMITEHCTALLESLNNDELRTIAIEKAAGATNQEVADTLGISLRSVERRVAEIRELWSRHGLVC